jgi:peptide/nickel transport system substrate-binding protein
VRRSASAGMMIVMLVALLLSACGAPSTQATPMSTDAGETPSAGTLAPSVSPETSTLIVAVPANIEQLDPNYGITSVTAMTVVANTYDQLTEYETYMSEDGYLLDDTESILGAVAESYEISPDGMDVTYHIRQGLTFHDGTPLTAEAVKFTFDRIVESEGVGYYYVDMAGASTTDAFEVIDEHTLVMHLEQPNVLAMKVLTLLNIVPVNPNLLQQHMTDDDPFGQDWLSINEAGSGPFILESYTPDSEVVLRRFDDYWKGPAALERVIIKIIPSVADRILALESGDVDLIIDVPPRDVERLEANPDVKVVSAPARKPRVLQMSHDISPLDNIKVRQAIAYAIPYETIVEEVYEGAAQLLRNPVLAIGTPTYTEEFWTYDTDLDRARELLAEAGYPDGFDTSIAVVAGIEEDEEMAVWIKTNLEQIGIHVEVESMPMAAYLTEARAQELPLFLSEMGMWVNDPFYTYYFELLTGGGANEGNYSNAEVDSLIEEYFASTDLEARAEASKRIQEIACEEVPLLPLAQANINVAMRKNVQGFYFSFDGTHVYRFYTLYKE